MRKNTSSETYQNLLDVETCPSQNALGMSTRN